MPAGSEVTCPHVDAVGLASKASSATTTVMVLVASPAAPAGALLPAVIARAVRQAAGAARRSQKTRLRDPMRSPQVDSATLDPSVAAARDSHSDCTGSKVP